MYFIETLALEGLGNRSYLAGGRTAAVAVDPPRDVDQILAMAARRGVRITHVVETHLHNDYVTGGLELARLTGARYHVPAGARVAFDRVPVTDGDTTEVEGGLVLRAVATPGHTPHHTSYVLEDGGTPVAAFTGGSLLIGAVGRPDLVDPRLTERLARAQHASARRLAELPDQVRVLPTHGFGSFCSSTQAQGDSTTIGAEKARNAALTKDVDAFVAELLAHLDDVPAYYTHMSPANAAGPAPVDLTEPRHADAAQIAERLAAGEWVVDLRNRIAFADGHVAAALNFELDGKLATYLAWLIPWGRPVTLLAESPEQIAAAQRELVRVGIDRPAAAATGAPEQWVTDPAALRSYPRADFAELTEARAWGEDLVVLDVRRASERATGHIEGSVHIPLHQLRQRLHEVPDGKVWVHCGSGMRAAIAASLLDAAGRQVVAVDDDFPAAHDADLVVRGQRGQIV
ncbi:MBL fold metallo-hydrolase [Actinoallomurus liliacearum]|uniref:MBL fold metallo-hydrolase n=1 Tax=Actinoallomurus liliacearum TaxID=1080073 RepID=A0ABP8TQV4_9ACTN